MIRVEVVYALPLVQDVCVLELPDGTTAQEAVMRSKYAQCDLSVHTLSVYGRAITPETVLRDRDRVEILRPLRVTPEEARRRRHSRSRAN
jgi:uncharacterized protein